MDTIINTMRRIGKFKSLSGCQKKKLVLEILELHPPKSELTLKELIDVLISLDQGEISINDTASALRSKRRRGLRWNWNWRGFFNSAAANRH